MGGGQRGVMSRASSNASEARPVMGAPSSIVSTLGIVPGCSGLRDIDPSPFTITILWVCPRGESLLPCYKCLSLPFSLFAVFLKYLAPCVPLHIAQVRWERGAYVHDHGLARSDFVCSVNPSFEGE